MNIVSGLKKDLHDGRDFSFGNYLQDYEKNIGEVVIDWDSGYDVESDLGFIFPIKNQFSSSSCVGQATSYYKETIEYWLKRSTREKSAKSIYSQIFLPQGGAYFRDGLRVATEYGINFETDVPSYTDGVTTETFLRDRDWINSLLTKSASLFANQNYYSVKGYDIDTFAKAIKLGKGALIGVTGNNNTTWHTVFPKVPKKDTPDNELWNHALYAVGYKLINNKKHIKVKQSWGAVGESGYQYLSEEWFKNEGRCIFNPWVICPKNMFTQNDLKHAHAYTIFITGGLDGRKQRQGFCINRDNENKLIIADEAIITKLREDISQKEYKDASGESFWAFSTPKLTIEITNTDYNALNKYDQSWNILEDNI